MIIIVFLTWYTVIKNKNTIKNNYFQTLKKYNILLNINKQMLTMTLILNA